MTRTVWLCADPCWALARKPESSGAMRLFSLLCANAMLVARSSAMLSRLPQAALWRSPRPAGFCDFCVRTIESHPFHHGQIKLQTSAHPCCCKGTTIGVPVSCCFCMRLMSLDRPGWDTLSCLGGHGTGCPGQRFGARDLGLAERGYQRLAGVRRFESRRIMSLDSGCFGGGWPLRHFRHGGHQAPRVFVAGSEQDLFGGPGFNDLAFVQDRDA